MSTQLVGLYFSASYCKWCDEFTPKLKSIYSELKASGIDIILVGSDKSPEAYESYASDHPWSVIPYGDEDRAQLRAKFGVKTIPALIFCNDEGDIIDDQGRAIVADEFDKSNDPAVVAQGVAHKLDIAEFEYDSDNSDF